MRPMLPTLRSRIFIVLGLTLLLISGCSGEDEPKPVIHVHIRPNQVEAQAAQNMYASDNHRFTSATLSTALLPPPTQTPVNTATPLPTPTPPFVPIGRPQRLVIPSIQIDTAVEPVYVLQSQIGDQWFRNWSTASYAAGYHASSALLGQAGNTVISGHNNIDGAVFRELYQLQPGEVFHLYANGFRYDYVVEEQFIVREAGAPLEQRVQNASWIQTTIDERVTLVSCWPPDGNDYRVIVIAKPIRSAD